MSDPDPVTELHPGAAPVIDPEPDGTTDAEGDQPQPAASTDQR